MQEMLIALCTLVCILTIIAGGTWGLRRLIIWSKKLRSNLRIHAWTALIWTAITFSTTLCLLLEPILIPHLLPTLVVYIAGWTMIASWREFVSRRHLEQSQDWRSLPRRLFRQSLWGPLALWFGCIGIHHLAEVALWNAIDHRDLVQIHLLHEYGFDLDLDGEGWFEEGNYSRIQSKFSESVRTGDVSNVSTCLEVAPFLLNNVLSNTSETGITKNLTVLRLVLDYYKTTGRRPDLIGAIIGNNVEAARLLIWNGADPNAEIYFKDDIRSLLWIARNQQENHHWDKTMIRLLKAAGAKE